MLNTEIFFKPEIDRPYPFNPDGRRLRSAIKSRNKAGDTIAELADEHNLDVEIVRAIVTITPF